MSLQKYSVLMSVYVKEKPEFLRESMMSMYEQTVPTDDFVLVCDGPLNEGLDSVIDEMQSKFGKRLHVFRLEKNQGLGLALRFGVEKCKNEFIARMDSDDISRKNRCEKELQIFAKHPEFSAVGSIVGEFETTIDNIKSVRKVPESNNEIIKFAQLRNPLNHPSVMFRKKDVLVVGNYPGMKKCQDWYLWTNLLMNGYKCYNIQEVLVYMREDKATFARRSGWSYFQTQKKLIDNMQRHKFISLPKYFVVLSMRFGSAMIPNGLRKVVFESFMRKKVNNKTAFLKEDNG